MLWHGKGPSESNIMLDKYYVYSYYVKEPLPQLNVVNLRELIDKKANTLLKNVQCKYRVFNSIDMVSTQNSTLVQAFNRHV